jgi:hypothetical protein
MEEGRFYETSMKMYQIATAHISFYISWEVVPLDIGFVGSRDDLDMKGNRNFVATGRVVSPFTG